MNLLFFDTETNGLPLNYKASYEEVENWPRVTQLAWILTSEEGEVIYSRVDLIKPDGWQMPTEDFWKENGFSQEKSEAEGIPILEALKAFHGAKTLDPDTVLVAHNLNFDHRILWAEFIRNGLKPVSGLPKICTMLKSTALCRIPAKNGRGLKWPTLMELHTFLFAKGFDGAHDASADITATMQCFFELLRLGVVELPPALNPQI